MAFGLVGLRSFSWSLRSSGRWMRKEGKDDDDDDYHYEPFDDHDHFQPA